MRSAILQTTFVTERASLAELGVQVNPLLVDAQNSGRGPLMVNAQNSGRCAEMNEGLSHLLESQDLTLRNGPIDELDLRNGPIEEFNNQQISSTFGNTMAIKTNIDPGVDNGRESQEEDTKSKTKYFSATQTPRTLVKLNPTTSVVDMQMSVVDLQILDESRHASPSISFEKGRPLKRPLALAKNDYLHSNFSPHLNKNKSPSKTPKFLNGFEIMNKKDGRKNIKKDSKRDSKSDSKPSDDVSQDQDKNISRRNSIS